MKLADTVEERVDLKFFDVWAETENVGGREEPIIHMETRDSDRNRVHVEVEGFTPYFDIPLPLLDDDTVRALESDARVQDVSLADEKGVIPYEWRDELESNEERVESSSEDESPCKGEARTGWARTPMVRVETNVPYDVRDLRDEFDFTGEADVRFADRFLIDSGIRSSFSVPSDVRERRVTIDELEPMECTCNHD